MTSSYYNLEQFIEAAESWGLTDVMLPFLLIFIILFAVLQKSHILGENKKNLNVFTAIIFGLLVIIPHVTDSYPSGYDVVDIMNNALPTVSIFIVAVIMLLILLGIFGADATVFGQKLNIWIIILSALTIFFIFGAAADWWNGWTWISDFLGEDAVALVIILLVFGIVISFITGGEKETEKVGAMSRVGRDLGEIFKRN